MDSLRDYDLVILSASPIQYHQSITNQQLIEYVKTNLKEAELIHFLQQ